MLQPSSTIFNQFQELIVFLTWSCLPPVWFHGCSTFLKQLLLLLGWMFSFSTWMSGIACIRLTDQTLMDGKFMEIPPSNGWNITVWYSLLLFHWSVYWQAELTCSHALFIPRVWAWCRITACHSQGKTSERPWIIWPKSMLILVPYVLFFFNVLFLLWDCNYPELGSCLDFYLVNQAIVA